MSAIPPAGSSFCFSEPELAMLSKTADALSAYLGKPVLAEVSTGDAGREWVAFGTPIDVSDEATAEAPHVQLGGKQARLLGGRGGLPIDDETVYDCLFLWAVEISTGGAAQAEEAEASSFATRFVKLDQDGEEAAWSDDLTDVLPFALGDDALMADDDDEDDEDDEEGDDGGEDDDDDAPPMHVHPAPPYRH